MDSSNRHHTGADLYDEEPPPRPGARRRWPLAAGVVIVALAAVAGGVAVAGNMRPADPVPAAASTAAVAAPTESASLTTTPSPTTAAPVSVTPSASSAPATEGTPSGNANGRYVSAAAGVSFTLPDRWTAEESTNQNPGYPGTGITIFNEARMQVATLYHGATGAVGGACPSGTYKMTELDTAPAVDAPWAKAMGVRFSFRVLDMRANGGAFKYQIGLVDKNSGEIKDSCSMYTFVAGAPKGTLIFADRSSQGPGNDEPIFDSLAEAKDFMRSPDYRKLKAMIVSLQMQD